MSDENVRFFPDTGEILRSRASIDWLEMSEWISPDHAELWKTFFSILENAKGSAQKTKVPEAVQVFGQTLVVYGYGMDRNYEYYFEMAGFRVWASARPTGRETPQPNFRIFMSGFLLLNQPLDNLVCWWRQFIEENGGKFVRETVSRTDLCCDVNVSMEYWANAVRENRLIGDPVKERPVGNRRANRWETLQFGVGGLQLRIYDKPLELKAKGELNALEAIKSRVGYPFSRVEFQIRREILGNKFRVEDYNSLIERGRQIAVHCTKRWFRIAAGQVNRSHTERSRIDEAWAEVSDAMQKCFGEKERNDSIDSKETVVILDHLVAQQLGLMCRIAGEGQGDLERDIDDVIDRAALLAKEYLRAKGRKHAAKAFQKYWVARQLVMMRRQQGGEVKALKEVAKKQFDREVKQVQHYLGEASGEGPSTELMTDFELFGQKYFVEF